MIRNNTARKMLHAWHGGQWSAFYAAASSGLVSSFPDLKAECQECFNTATSAKDRGDLSRLMEWVIYWQGRSTVWVDPIDGKTYRALKWAILPV